MKLIKIDDIKLDEGLYFESEFIADRIRSTSVVDLGGNEIVFISNVNNQNLSVSSSGTAWISKDTLQKLIIKANNSPDKALTLTTDSGDTIKARFDYTSTASVSGEALFAGSDMFSVSIRLKGI